MLYVSFLIIILFLFLDLLFYVPIYINIYIDRDSFYLSLYSLFIVRVDNKKNINLLKNKLDLNKLKTTRKEDLEMIKSIKIDRIYLRVPRGLSYHYSYVFYPLYSLNISKIVDYKIDDKFKLYTKVKMNLVNIVFEFLKIRRMKNERTSN